MNTRVISISRQVGTAGEEVATALAERLGFRFIDYQLIQDAAHEAGVSPETVSEAEHTPSLMTRLLESLARNPSMPAAGWADPIPMATNPLNTSTDYRKFVEQVIRETANKGECIIVGHAAQVILRDRLDTVRVLVTGTHAHRVRRIKAGMERRQRSVEDSSKGPIRRLEYFKRFYDTGWLKPRIRPHRFNRPPEPETGAELIARAAGCADLRLRGPAIFATALLAACGGDDDDDAASPRTSPRHHRNHRRELIPTSPARLHRRPRGGIARRVETETRSCPVRKRQRRGQSAPARSRTFGQHERRHRAVNASRSLKNTRQTSRRQHRQVLHRSTRAPSRSSRPTPTMPRDARLSDIHRFGRAIVIIYTIGPPAPNRSNRKQVAEHSAPAPPRTRHWPLALASLKRPGRCSRRSKFSSKFQPRPP